MEEHQREQAERLRLVGHQRRERPAEPDRLAAEPAADIGVAGVEDQVDVASTASSRAGSASSGGTRNGMPAARILCFARTSRWAIVGSLVRKARAISGVVSPPSRRSVSATCASIGERRVAAREDQRQALVGDRAHVLFLLVGRVSSASRASSARFVSSVRSRRSRSIARLRAVGDDPGARVRRDAVAGPALGGDRERLLDGVLGEVEVAERADQDRDRAPELLPECLGDRVYGCLAGTGISGRTSTAPYSAPGQRAAIASASSSVSTSIR